MALRKKPSRKPTLEDPKPSQITDVYWVGATRRTGTYPAHSANGGKWLVFLPAAQVDDVWRAIKTATEEGRLGDSAKVATAKPNPNATNPNTKVICIYTYDWTDETDVKRIREELRHLGITRKIPYKADADTVAGKYANRGATGFTKYTE